MSGIIFLETQADREKQSDKLFPKSYAHPFSISHKTEANKVYHQENRKDSLEQMPIIVQRMLF